MFRAFRQSPLPSVGISARQSLARAVSLNERLQTMLHPWTSYVIVPLFALANAGVDLRDGVLADALCLAGDLGRRRSASSSASWSGSAWRRWAPCGSGSARCRGASGPARCSAARRSRASASRSRCSSPTWRSTTQPADGGDRRRAARRRRSPRCTGWVVFSGAAVAARRAHRDAAAVPRPSRRPRARPHPRAPRRAAHARRVRRLRVPVLRPRDRRRCSELRALLGDDLRYVFRHLPLTDVHDHAELAAQAAEAAGAQGALLGDARPPVRPPGPSSSYEDLVGYAGELGLDVERFADDLHEGRLAARVRARRRERRGQRRARHADVLRRRPPARRPVRRPDPRRRAERPAQH